MPYIITAVTQRDTEGATKFEQTQRAVHDLDDAREEVTLIAAEHVIGATDAEWRSWEDRCNAIPDEGGTVGPLLDGTVITVEKVDA